MASETPRRLPIAKIVIWGVMLAAAGIIVLPRLLSPPTPEADVAVAAQPPQGLSPGTAMNAPFDLLNEEGEAVTEADFAGRPSAWFYGFTNCPDVCPTALAELASLLEQLGPEAEKLNAVFVTVDPERDTVEVMKKYVDYFDERIIGLTGELRQVEAMAKARFVKFAKVIGDNGNYVMQHSASIFLVDATGAFVGTLDPEEPLSTKLSKLQRLVGV